MPNISNNLKSLTKSYYDLQQHINRINQQLQQIKEQKKYIETKLITEFKNNNLQNQAITYQGHKIYMNQENNYDTLSFKFLEECLLKLFKNNKEKTQQIIKFIKSQRKKQTLTHIKIK